jgi:hypothetical protein
MAIGIFIGVFEAKEDTKKGAGDISFNKICDINSRFPSCLLLKEIINNSKDLKNSL